MDAENAPDVLHEEKKEKKDKKSKFNKEEFTVERARLAQERTMLAWVRTATTFMTFGFALFKFLQSIENQVNRPRFLDWVSPRMIGLSMLITGLVGLVLSVYRHYGVMKRLSNYTTTSFFTPVLILAYTVGTLLLLLIAATLFK